LILIVVLFLLLITAAVYQIALGGHSERLCGPHEAGALPTQGACPSPTPAPTAS